MKIYFLLLFLSVPSAAIACECAGIHTMGFLSGDDDPYILPSNARGVLFQTDYAAKIKPTFVEKNDFGEEVESDYPLKIRSSQIEVKDLTSKKLVPVEIKPFKQFNGIIRVEPKSGFKAGHKYQFTYKPKRVDPYVDMQSSLVVKVQDQKLQSSSLKSIKFVKDGSLKVRKISIPDQGSCSLKIWAVTQSFQWEVPKEMAAYKEMLRFFTIGAREGGTKRLWFYDDDSCSSRTFGRSSMDLGKDLLYVKCDGDDEVTPELGVTYGAQANIGYKVYGYVGALEVEDGINEASIVDFKVNDQVYAKCKRLVADELKDNPKQAERFSDADEEGD